MGRMGSRAVRIALVALAVAATFGIGFFVGREIARPASPPAGLSAQDGLEAWKSVDADLMRYRVIRSFAVDLQAPRGIACGADGTVYVCGDRALVSMTPAGVVKRRYALDGEPRCVAAAPDGRLFVGMGDHVEALDPSRGDAEMWPDLGSQAIVTCVSVSSEGVFVADAGNREVLRFDLGGTLKGRIGGGFIVPSPFFDIVASPDGTLWATDPGAQSVRHYGAKGELLGSWGKSSLDIEGFGGCCNPAHIAQLPCGRIVTSEKGIVRIKVYEPNGKLSDVVAMPRDFPPSEASLDIATRRANGGEILVLVPSQRTVRVYAEKDDGSGG